MLPNLTPLQYLVLHLLFVGRQSGDELRRALRALGVRQSRAAFSRLMARLVDANYVDPRSAVRADAGQTIHFRCYEITDQGILDWTAARKFYVNLAPPSHNLTPVATLEGEMAAYDPKERKSVFRRAIHESLARFVFATLHRDLKLPCKKA
jgi:hypothetical protein